jgi:peptide/nickel transport system substrate-binding protein
MNLEAGLAESWTNPDPTTWRLKLRRGVKFSSGDVFTAKDVKYSIEQAKASEHDEQPWVSQTMAARVDSVKIIDDYTLDLKTKEPDATLLSWLVFLGIVSQDQVKRDGLSKAVGTGPYQLLSLTDDEAVLQANDGYWGGKPKVNRLVYKNIEDPDEAKKALLDGSLDLISDPTLGNDDLSGKGFQLANLRTGGIVYISFDVNSVKSKYVTAAKNPFKDKRVRKAIQLALDIPEMISAAGIDAEPITQFAIPDLIGYNPNLTWPNRDVVAARRLLTEAGFADGFTVTVDAEQTPVNTVTLGEMKKQLAEIGIIVRPNFIETDAYFLKLDSGPDSAILHTTYYPDTIDSLDFLDTVFHPKIGSHGYNNLNNYLNPEITTVLNQAIATFDVQKRIELTRKAHSLVMEDLSSLPLYTEENQVFARDTLTYKPSISIFILGFDISGRQKTR